MAIEHVMTCHSVTRLGLIALPSTSGRIFKYRHVLILGWKKTAKVNKKLTSSFLLKWRNLRRKLFNYWLRLTVKTACLVHTCMNGTNDFRKAEKAWKMMIAQAVPAQLLPMTTLNTARYDSKRLKDGCLSSSWGS